jgi:hypothetical protein
MWVLAANDPANRGWAFDVSISLDHVGDVRRAMGDRAGALAAFEESLAIRRKLAGNDPANADAQRGVTLSLDRIGDMRAVEGDRAGALLAYREGLEIRRRLAAADPTNAQQDSDLVISLAKAGIVSDAPRAHVLLREGLAIIQKLAGEGRLTAAQQGWPEIIRRALAKLPPERADNSAHPLPWGYTVRRLP